MPTGKKITTLQPDLSTLVLHQQTDIDVRLL